MSSSDTDPPDAEALIRQLFRIQATLSAMFEGQTDVILDPDTASPMLLHAAQMALQHSDERYRRLTSSIGAIVFELDENGDTVFVNEAVTAITGYAPSDLQGKNWWAILCPGFWSRQVPPLLKRLQQSDVHKHEVRVQATDGHIVYLELDTANIYSAEGVLERVCGFGIDHTDTYLARQALVESEERLRAIFEHALDGMLLIDATRRYVDANPAMCHMIGYSREELLGKTLADITPPSEIERVEEVWKAFLSRGMLTGEYRLLHKDGRVRTVEFSAVAHIIPGIHLASLRDVTEVKAAEEQRDKLFQLSEQSPNMIMMSDDQGNLQYVNPSFTEQTGYEQAEVLGSRDYFLSSPFAAQPALHDLMEAIEDRREWHGEIQNRRKNGELFWVSATVFPIALPQSSAVFFASIQTNITELKLAQDAEREQRVLAETLAQSAAVLNSSLKLEQVLDEILVRIEEAIPCDAASIALLHEGIARFSRTRGYYVKTGQDQWLKHLELPVRQSKNLHQMVLTKKPLYIPDTYAASEWRQLSETTWIHAHLGCPILLDNQVLGFILLDAQQTNRFVEAHIVYLQAFANQAAIAIHNAQLYEELAEYNTILEQAVEERTAELRHAKEQVDVILSHNPDAVLLLEGDGQIVSANPAFVQLFQQQPETVIGQKISILVMPDDQIVIDRALDSVINLGTQYRAEFMAQRGDASTFEAEITLAAITEPERAIGAVCVIRDITELKALDRMKDEFVSNVSHELRTPITSIKLNHQLAKQNPVRSEIYMDRIRRETDRLHSIIEDLLRISRLDQKHGDIYVACVDLRDLILQFTQDRVPLAESKNLTLHTAVSDHPLSVEGDEQLLEQVLSILLTNAINYTPSGGRVEVEGLTEMRQNVQWAGFCVRDTGPGIAAAEMPHLFKRFFRGTAGRETSAPGTGLGLSIAKEIVELHHGRLEIMSEGIPGHGAAFTVWLPVKESSNG